MSVTLQELRLQVWERADMEYAESDDGGIVSKSECNKYINLAYKELFDILVSKYEDYKVADTPWQFTLSSGEDSKALQSDVYKIIGVDRQLGSGDWYEVTKFNFKNRNIRRSSDIHRGVYPNVMYRLLGSKIKFVPEGEAEGTYRVWYVEKAVSMSDDSDTIDEVNGWEDYIIVTAAIKCLTKEESDTTDLKQEKIELIRRINLMAQNRDAGNDEQVTDVTQEGYDDPLFYR